ncbi:band 4.1-like protein 3a isoform X17 [Latimeria chalumnae]|uniref:band 4.1-like protein 3a isoform X17 n=1 Tax=Latimeria chalumnae TaxID=7897 RepID=UPI0006D8EFD6|nr:PREDICTED: band 4.1-like protein 3 isoform X16 [Latimeria chalumnae]|eukprot:XP_014346722.1 PREDICTED: band 4.1-like protein 3 isoform X16 [Latimeria chalumnae]
MATESGSDSESKKDQEQGQQEALDPAQQGAAGGQQHPQESGENQFSSDQFHSAVAHSTPVKKEQQGEREREEAATAVKQQDYQLLEEDKVSQKSLSSKLSRSPLKVVKKPKNMQCKVTLLDGSEYTCEVEKRSKGQVLFDKACEHLNLLEKDYFGLTYRDSENQKNWLDPAKEIKKQIRSGTWQFAFNVKFYPPDPSQLTEDITRYYLCLQLRDDIVSGRLPCSFVTHALLGSYTVQSELGDYDPEEYGSDYVNEFRFAPNQTKELEEKVMELHKSHKGMTPAEAEMHFLENAKKLSMYGVDLHHARDSEGVDIMLGVCASGLLIYRDRLRINRFAWPKVLKISYKRNNFYIKIRPGEVRFEQFESTIGFKLANHRAAKRLWKVCVEHHTFFRLVLPEAPPKKFLTLGSKFRYSGRTQAQSRRASALIDRPAPYFERSTSKRYTMSRSLDGASVSENHEIYMKDSMSATEVGTGQYSTTKGISSTNLITTVTPEKKAEEEKAEEAVKKQQAETELTPGTSVRHDTKTDSEQTDTAADGETTATETSLINRIHGENLYVKHSNLMLEDLDKAQEDLIKHQTNVSELKRTFLETSTELTGPTEWEKRMSTSPVRTVTRQEEAPMIEPLMPEEQTKEVKGPSEKQSPMEVVTQHGKMVTRLEEGTAAGTMVTSHQFIIRKTISSAPEKSDPKMEWESLKRTKEEVHHQEQIAEKVVQESVVLETKRVVNVHASGDAANLAGVEWDATELAASALLASEKGEKGSAVAASAREERREQADQAVTKKVEESAAPSQELGEQQDAKPQVSEESEEKPEFEPPVVKTEPISFGSVKQEERQEISTKEVPVVHTETKTITYESSQVDSGADLEPGVLMSAQTITSETTSTTTTTHITKTVKGGISETRIEKRIVITGDADIDHDQALAQAIKEAKEQHPDMSVTKVVVHKETEITPENGED